MKIEKKSIVGCVNILSVDQLPARATSVGGQAYAVGSIIELDAVVEMLPIEGSSSKKNWYGVAAKINGAVAVIGFNTLLGVYFDENQKKQVLVNGINTMPISKMLGRVLTVVKTEEFQTLRFGTDEIIAKALPIFEFITVNSKK